MTQSEVTAILGILRQARAFETAPLVELQRLAPRCRLQRFRRGGQILRRGSPGESLVLVGRGRIKATLPSPTADGEFICGMFWPGDTFGELTLFGYGDRPVTAVAITESEVVFLPRAELLTLLERHPSITIRFLESLCDRYRITIETTMGLRFLDLQTRLYQRLLLLSRYDSPREEGRVRIQHGLSQQELADSIGASREALNKLLSDWKHCGLIEASRGCIVVIDSAGLGARVPASVHKDFILDSSVAPAVRSGDASPAD